ncbi:MAG: pantoate--beta-alanine ligase [Desulfuromonas sp.]|mgnify:CR=1 FL=1|nr:MAG: pantoate--beta-alanine ligase [Desulfuromonas sp.]
MSTASSNSAPQVIHDIGRMQHYCLKMRQAGKKIGFVPTMGYLHEGHLSLLREARRRSEILILSIFINPTQFGANEDLDSYPRDLDRDLELAASCETDLVFAPLPQDVYPGGYATYVNVEGLTETLCGASRPDHFRGVTTVVNKLFNIVQPDSAYFGEKDFQQLAVIRRMVLDLNMPVEVIGLPIVREADGLAMSSRNVYLSPEQRQQALVLSRALNRARTLAAGGELNGSVILKEISEMIEREPEARIDYLKICHRDSLREQQNVDADSVLLLAVFIGNTRLIDNSFILQG